MDDRGRADDKAEVERQEIAVKERGLGVTEMPSPNSPVPKKAITYNHRKEWTEVQASCYKAADSRKKDH